VGEIIEGTFRETDQFSWVEFAEWTFLIVPTFDSQSFAYSTMRGAE